MTQQDATRAAALHDDAQALLDQISASGGVPYEAMSVAEARAISAQFTAFAGFAPVEVGGTEDVILGQTGDGPLKGRLYRPYRTAGDRPTPALLFLHGGGWVVGDLDSHDSICRRFCADLGWPVLAVDYRLAPEHRFPAAPDDAFMATRWLHDHADTLGVDATRIAVCGDSAGGNLAAVVAIAARDRLIPPIAYQMLIYPVTDLLEEHPSYARVTEGMPVTAATMRWFKDLYLARPQDAVDWRASPYRVPDLTGVAPALVLTVQHDPLCDEGIAYARRLMDAGVQVTHTHFSQHVHGLINMGATMRDAETVMAIATAAVRAALRPPLQPTMP